MAAMDDELLPDGTNDEHDLPDSDPLDLLDDEEELLDDEAEATWSWDGERWTQVA